MNQLLKGVWLGGFFFRVGIFIAEGTRGNWDSLYALWIVVCWLGYRMYNIMDELNLD